MLCLLLLSLLSTFSSSPSDPALRAALKPAPVVALTGGPTIPMVSESVVTVGEGMATYGVVNPFSGARFPSVDAAVGLPHSPHFFEDGGLLEAAGRRRRTLPRTSKLLAGTSALGPQSAHVIPLGRAWELRLCAEAAGAPTTTSASAWAGETFLPQETQGTSSSSVSSFFFRRSFLDGSPLPGRE